AAIAVGVAIAFFLMAVSAQYRFGVPLGAAAIAIATFGVLDLLGTFDDPDSRVATKVSLAALARPLALVVAGVAALGAFVSMGVAGPLPNIGLPPEAFAAVAIPGSFLATVVGVYRVGDALGVWQPNPDGTPRPLLHRHGFWLVVFTTAVYLPLLGSHS